MRTHSQVLQASAAGGLALGRDHAEDLAQVGRRRGGRGSGTLGERADGVSDEDVVARASGGEACRTRRVSVELF